MFNRRTIFNTKRKISDGASLGETLVKNVRYGGNPEHKRNPGDFGLTPPAAHRRADKSLCDGVGVVSRDVAIGLLKAGIGKGLISEQLRGGWPQNIWSVTDDGEPLEAELENSVTGTYHGYPMPKADPLRNEVLKKWHAS